jgi:DnaJ homolog subfamily B member 4
MSKQDKQTNSKEPSLKSHRATVYDASDSEEPSIQTAGMQLHTTTVVTTGVPSEWIFPLPLTLEELYEGTAHRYRISRHLLSGKTKNIMVDIDVAPGWKKGTKIRFAGAGNERQGGAPQDVVFIVEEMPHERFVRQGSALVARVQIPLVEALTGEGRSILVRGLNDKEVEVRIPPAIIKPGDEYRIEGAGMPIRKQGKIVGQGDMVIQFVHASAQLSSLTHRPRRWEISFPEKLGKKQAKELRKALKD